MPRFDYALLLSLSLSLSFHKFRRNTRCGADKIERIGNLRFASLRNPAAVQSARGELILGCGGARARARVILKLSLSDIDGEISIAG